MNIEENMTRAQLNRVPGKKKTDQVDIHVDLGWLHDLLVDELRSTVPWNGFDTVLRIEHDKVILRATQSDPCDEPE